MLATPVSLVMSPNFLDKTSAISSIIDGKPWQTSSTFAVIDPHTSAKLYDVHGVDEVEAVQAVEAAQRAFPAWRDTPYTQRRDILQKAVAIYETRREEFVAIERQETTSSLGMAMSDITWTIDALKETAGVVTTALKGDIPVPEMLGHRAYITREPFGVVLAIPPWNGPMVLSARAVTSPIIAGNTVVLKTSELSPLTHSIIAQVLAEAGLPAGVLSVIHVEPKNAPKVVEAIIAHPAVGKVNFTGSTRVGSIIGSLCGKHIKPVTLELGGAAPFIVLEDADIDHAVKTAVLGGFFNSGQTCMGTNTIILHESIASQFVAALQQNLANVKAGNEHPEKHQLRGLFSDISAKRVHDLVLNAVNQGAKVVVGPTPEGDHKGGNVFQATVLDGLTTEMDITHSEIFGPVVGIIHFKTDEEAIVLANRTEYGLSAAVHSRDVERALKIAKRIDASQVHINSFTLHDHPQHPHGGWKKSGYGRFNGLEGIREFTQTKVISVSEVGFTPGL